MVLCIDNDTKVLDGLTTLLAGWGCLVLKARGAKEAEAAVAAAARMPDIAIVDYHLDEDDGISLIESLRTRYDRDMAAVLITADRSPAVRQEAARAAMPVIHKPVRPAALRAVIAHARASRAVAAE